MFSQDWGLESSLEPMDSTSSCYNLSVMFLDSPDKILSHGRFKSDSPGNILSLGCPNIVSPEKSSCTGSKVPDSPDIVSSPDEQSELGSYSSLASVKCTFLVKLDFDLTLTSSVAWTWVYVLCYVNEVLRHRVLRHRDLSASSSPAGSLSTGNPVQRLDCEWSLAFFLFSQLLSTAAWPLSNHDYASPLLYLASHGASP